MIDFNKFFPKQFHRKFFPELSPKNLSVKRNNRPVRDFPKLPHRTFRRIPASKPNVMKPTLKTGTEKWAFLSFRHSPAYPANDRLPNCSISAL